MARLASPSPPPPSTPVRRKARHCARRCERVCCTVATYFPLAFIYSVTTWAVYVEAGIGLKADDPEKPRSRTVKPTSILGIVLYLLLNLCYTVAVFTDPGSPSAAHSSRAGKAAYSSLPTTEPSAHVHLPPTSVTVSSSGAPRYCKKCHTPKPDRAHHCSTCRRCVLKMDHHCPWLATCLGLHNYKSFILFLIYTSLFCCVCFVNSAHWVWTELFESNQYIEEFGPVNIILLTVVSGIIGLVLAGFTGWHIYLCSRGLTTIECLEKTRYLSGVRNHVERQRHDVNHRRSQSGVNGEVGRVAGVVETLQRAGEHILEFHANAVPGATRFEEGEEHTSPVPSLHRKPMEPSIDSGYPHSRQPHGAAEPSAAAASLRHTYATHESARERARYDEYLDSQASAKLPNAFDLGWRRNLAHLFGPRPALWALPVCNTTGDGYTWEVSERWRRAKDAADAELERLRSEEHHGQPEPQARAYQQHPYDGASAAAGHAGRDLEHGLAGAEVEMQVQRPGHALGRARQKRDLAADSSSDDDSDDDDDDDDSSGDDRDRGHSHGHGVWDGRQGGRRKHRD